MYRGIIIILFIMACPKGLFGQNTASVNGYVKDQTSGETLILAHIIMKGTSGGTTTNTSGYYAINDLKPGTYTFIFSYLGYKKYNVLLNLKPNQHLRLDVELKREDVELNEIVVKSKREKEEERDIGVSQLETKLIYDTPFVQPDVLRALQLMPGVQASSDLSSGVYIRGGSPDQTLISLDETTVYNPTHFFGFFSTFNPDAIKNVRMYKGGYPAMFGDRIGSVIDIHYKDGNNKKRENILSLGLLSSRFAMEGPLKKGSWIFTVRRSTLEPVLRLLNKYDRDIPENVYFWDFNGKFTIRPDKLDKFTLAVYSNADYVKNTFEDLSTLYLRHGNNAASMKWTHIFSQKVFSNFTAVGNYYYNVPRTLEAGTEFKRSNHIKELTLKGNIEILPNIKHEINFGWSAGLRSVSLNDFYLKKLSYSSDISNLYADGYLQDTWYPSGHWKIEIGLRSNYYSSGNYLRISPRSIIEYKPSDYVQLQGAFGLYHQYLSLSENDQITGFDIWQSTAKGVNPMSGKQYLFGIKTTPSNNFSIDVETYYRDMDHLFELNPLIPDYSGIPYNQLFLIGTGYAYGAEFTIQRQSRRLFTMLGYSYSISKRKFPGINKDRYYPSKYNRTNTLHAVIDYQISKNWKLSTVFSFATGQPYTSPDGMTQIVHSPLTSITRQILVINQINGKTMPDYHRLDLGFTHTGTFFGKGNADLQIQFINVYSHRNTWFYKYNFTASKITVEQVRLLPILPSLSYTIKW